jgi:hypothetical protein
MSASQSNLSASRYGYDFVVATTQGSINAAMKEYLAGLTEPVTTICFVADNQGNPVEIDYATLVTNAKGSDPFAVPNGADPATNADLQNLLGARFMMGFQVQLGLPDGYAPVAVPDIVALGADTSAVVFHHLCSEFKVVELEPGSGYAPSSWINLSQPSGDAWIFTSNVDLRLSTTDQSAYSQLPPDVQQQIKNLGGSAFSVQQLLFDLDNAGLSTVPDFGTNVPPGSKLYMALEQGFIGAYFTAMKKNGQPYLGCTIRHDDAPLSTLTLTDFNLEVSPPLGDNGQPIANPDNGQEDLATLDYLCAANGDVLPPAVAFAWNWVDPSEATDYDGVVAINRASFTNYFKSQLQSYVESNCFLASVRVWMSGFLDATTNYSWNLTPGQVPTVTTPATGTEVLTFHYQSSAEDGAGLNDDMGKMQLSSTFDLSVSFSGNTITIVQHLVVYLWVRSLQTSAGGNVVDRTLTDTYTLAVDSNGQLTATEQSAPLVDNSQNPSTNDFLNFFTDLNDIISDVENWVRGFTSTSLEDMPLSVVQDYVFPGGKTFAYKSVGFSDYGDLASHITYTGSN